VTFSAAIFDLDGTMVDNMALHAEAFGQFARRHGLPPLTAADRARIDGRRNSEIFPLLFGRAVARDEWLAYEVEKETLYRELSAGHLTPMPGLDHLLRQLSLRNIAVGLATSAPKPNVEHTLREIGLTGAFRVIVRGDEVKHGKPEPDVFIEAARRLDVDARDCLVFEDAPMGITAAHAAGMRVAALTTSFSEAGLRALAQPPEIICRDFDAFLDGPGAWLTNAAPAAAR
jgi:HAD superfamily hydrolase (TIGR01509 family)